MTLEDTNLFLMASNQLLQKRLKAKREEIEIFKEKLRI